MANHDNDHDNDDDGGVVTSLSLINSSKVINTPKMCAKYKGLRGQDWDVPEMWWRRPFTDN